MNANERIKKEQDGLDVLDSIKRYSKTGFSTIHEDDFTRMRWYGLYQQKPNEGHFMLRIKVPNGDISAAQVRTVAEVAKKYGRGITDITTRQNFQFHWLTIEDVPAILEAFSAVDIATAGACGDIVRNVTGCPVAGLDPDEIFDTRPYGMAIHDFFLGNKEFSDLPRKFKVSVAGCPLHCAQPEINDIAAVAVTRKRANGEIEHGFQVRVGGGLSARPYFAQPLDMFIPPEKLVSVTAAVVGIFRDHGNRENRKRARIKFLVADWGIEKIEEEVRARLDWTPDKGEGWPEPSKNFRDHMGIHPQKQEGLYWIGAAPLTGRLRAEQVFELARIAETYGDGNLRTTNQQNLVFPNVPQANIDAVVKALDIIGIPTSPSPFRRASVACTGSEFCNLAITETKNLLHEIVEHLEATVALDDAVRINLNGCPNSCGQHHIGDIGLQGCLVKKGGGVTVEGYDISLGGRLGADPRFVRAIWRKVPATDVKFALENLLNGYLEERAEEEDFSDFVLRNEDDHLASLMKTTFAEGVEV